MGINSSLPPGGREVINPRRGRRLASPRYSIPRGRFPSWEFGGECVSAGHDTCSVRTPLRSEWKRGSARAHIHMEMTCVSPVLAVTPSLDRLTLDSCSVRIPPGRSLSAWKEAGGKNTGYTRGGPRGTVHHTSARYPPCHTTPLHPARGHLSRGRGKSESLSILMYTHVYSCILTGVPSPEVLGE